MKINILKAESALFGQNIIQLENWNTVEEIIVAEKETLKKYKPSYIYCQVIATNIQAIQQLEELGFSFNEFRIKSMMHTDDYSISAGSFYPFYAEPITEKNDLEKAVKILLSNRQDDRFSNDPVLNRNFSRKRIEANLRKSFKLNHKEFLIGLFNDQRDELVAFRSGAFLSKNEAHYYQYGVHPGFDFDHTAKMLEAFAIDYLISKNIKIIYAISTGFNTDELNRLLKNYDFRVVSTQVLMRKVYKQNL